MGKTRKQVKYDRQALHLLATEIVKFRQPLSGNMIPKITVDENQLEDAVKNLSKKEREILEKFWGLIPGTKNMVSSARVQILKDKAFGNFVMSAHHLMEKLTSIDYLHFFDKNVKELIEKIVSKINLEGCV